MCQNTVLDFLKEEYLSGNTDFMTVKEIQKRMQDKYKDKKIPTLNSLYNNVGRLLAWNSLDFRARRKGYTQFHREFRISSFIVEKLKK